jgi:glycosyltransferase involved in cell wall biosynthesis
MSTHLVLFFTRGVSLRTWGMLGMLEREIAIYKRLLRRGFDVSFLTYGGTTDLDYADQLGGIRILCNRTGLPPEVYQNSLCSLHGDSLSSCHIIKTNQIYGADLALSACQTFQKPLVARCGYLWSQNAAREHGPTSETAVIARKVEERVFRGADRVVVTTAAMREDVLQRVPEAASKVVVIPNYVDTEVFRPQSAARDETTLIFVGRIAPEKNLAALLEAIEPLQVRLTIIGEGRIRPELQRRFGLLNGRIDWEGNVPNSELPARLNGTGIFVLPSLYEGHPKALIEAMACGMPVIGADSPGIREIISHEETGYLCNIDPVGIRKAIQTLLASPTLRARMGQNAREYVLGNYSLDKIVESELALLKETARQ